uniref:Uncharacterized protein n=1 Tax=Cacopsylla melanoneura TaxID=428564 RepID=A0A8D8TVR7_9HEMI
MFNQGDLTIGWTMTPFWSTVKLNFKLSYNLDIFFSFSFFKTVKYNFKAKKKIIPYKLKIYASHNFYNTSSFVKLICSRKMIQKLRPTKRERGEIRVKRVREIRKNSPKKRERARKITDCKNRHFA